MKKILIIGANGKVGRLIVEKLKNETDFKPIAFIRDEKQAIFFDDIDVKHIVGSVEGTVESIAEVMSGVDVIVFTAGSGGKTGYDKTLSVDLDGAVKTMEAALKANVKRYIMVSAIHADNREAWDTSKIKPYYIAKHYADRILKTIGLDYTILRPGRLLDEPGTGKIATANPEWEDRRDHATVVYDGAARTATLTPP